MEPSGADAANSSPLPRKPRGKYASRACVECRQRKLKCSGEEPCERCMRRGHRCVFSDDRAVQELLRSTRQQLVGGNANGTSNLDSRVERLETALQALTDRIDNGEEASSGQEEAVTTDQSSGFQGDTAFRSPVDQFNENLAHVRQQLGFTNGPTVSPISTRRSLPSGRAADLTLPPLRQEHNLGSIEIRIGGRTFPFPSPSHFQRYLDFFFEDINACHPCVNEGDFRSRSEAMLASPHLDRRESCFLALHFIIFACADILQEVSSESHSRDSKGSHWYRAAEELVGRTKYNGQGDLVLIQYLIFEAFYLTHGDQPNAAFNISGLACRLCLQFGLHTQVRWSEDNQSYHSHMKQRLLWTTYFVDRRIALSVGRPYGLADRDIEVQLPAWVADRDLAADKPLPDLDAADSYMPYLGCMVQFAKLGGEIWDTMFSAGASKTTPSAETIAVLDAKIQHWAETVLPKVPLVPTNSAPSLRHQRQWTLVYTRVNHLRLLLRRQLMVSMAGSEHDCRICGDLAVNVVQQIMQHSDEASKPSSFRFHMAVSLGGALLVLSTLLCRPLADLGLHDCFNSYLDAFRQALSLIREVGQGLCAARRILADLRDIIEVVERITSQPTPQQNMMQLPANLDTIIPYGAVDFAQVSGYPYEAQITGDFQQSWYDSGLNGWHRAETHMQGMNGSYGAPWI